MARRTMWTWVAMGLLVPAAAVAQVCGDATCNGPGETQCNCPADCLASNTDGCCLVTGTTGDNCNVDTACACPGTTGPCTMAPPPAPSGIYFCADCGNNVCEAGENYCNCPNINFVVWTGDCAPACGDGCCTSGEDANSCPTDCLSWCGNFVCEPGEDDCSCADEGCGVSCGDGSCCAVGGENPTTCIADCSECGDDLCTGTENCASCYTDCTCEAGESCLTDEEPAVCGVPPNCGDGECAGETCASCPDDCGGCQDAGSSDGGGNGNGGGTADGPKNLYACDCSIGARSAPMAMMLVFLALGTLARRLHPRRRR